MCVYACVYAHVYTGMSNSVLLEAKRGNWIPQSWSYTHLWAAWLVLSAKI